ncbi:peptide transporter PTR2-A [Coccidioides immitis H538.4]|uniref:Peptide transporter PTR2-A n=1 Tax=Coccidioides immitis H538.4 TaxID=396776 RepID=A0A0J8RKC2_COCIT|nr:peptide transporter PTR2-A [Coccidioides immitis H538.4]
MADHESQATRPHQQLGDPDAKVMAADGMEKETSPDSRSIEAGYVTKEGQLHETPDGEEPTEEEKRTLKHVPESLPISAWLVAIVELCERFTYYGMQGLFQNYIQRPLDGSLGRGALGLGHRAATGLNTFFQFWAYLTPIIGAIIADQYIGKYMAIFYFCIIYVIGLLILVLTSLPVSLQNGAGLGGFVVSLIVIGLGTGGIKSNVAPLIADQYKRKTMAIKTTPEGERVIIDPGLTIQRIYMIFYACINIGSLSLLATPYMERDIGFWSAYLLCLCIFVVGTCILVLGRKFYVVRPPTGSIITNAFKALGVMVMNRNMDAPKPSWQAEHGANRTYPWDDHFIDELKRALVACKVFTFYPIYWVVYSQFSTNFVSQETSFTLRRHAITCHWPCPEAEVDGVKQGNRIHIAIQAPAYMLIGISEIFASVSELRAPPTMKSFVQSMYLLTNAFGAALGEALTPVAHDPEIIWLFTGLACSSFTAGILFWIVFRHLNAKEEDMNALDKDDTVESN